MAPFRLALTRPLPPSPRPFLSDKNVRYKKLLPLDLTFVSSIPLHLVRLCSSPTRNRTFSLHPPSPNLESPAPSLARYCRISSITARFTPTAVFIRAQTSQLAHIITYTSFSRVCLSCTSTLLYRYINVNSRHRAFRGYRARPHLLTYHRTSYGNRDPSSSTSLLASDSPMLRRQHASPMLDEAGLISLVIKAGASYVDGVTTAKYSDRIYTRSYLLCISNRKCPTSS